MPVNVKEWLQEHWRRPGAARYRDHGDLDTLDGLILSADRQALRRAPAWSAYTEIEFSPVSRPNELYAAFTDAGTHPVAFVVKNGSNLESVYYVSGPYYAHTVLTAVVTALAGRDGQNVLWHGGHFYVIGSDNHVYRGATYKGAIAAFYSGGDASILVAWRDRVHMITVTGDVYRLNDGDSAFEVLSNSIDALNVLFATPYRSYLLLVALGTDGTLSIYQLYSAGALATIATQRNLPYSTTAAANLFAPHNDRIYFIPNGYYALDNGNYAVDVYAFNGTWISFVDQVELTTTVPANIGLLSWQRNQLVLYALYDSVGLADATHHFKILTGSRFTALPDLTDGAINVSPIAANLTGQLLVTTDNDDGQGTADVGFHTLGAGSVQASGGLYDGWIQTSYLDMDHPGKEKRLNRITAILDGAASSFKVLLKYRLDDNAGWTTAVTADNTRRPVYTFAGPLAPSFHVMQLRLDIDDDTGNNEDFRLQALSIVYTIAE